jgi:hypothetical protein
MKETIIKGWDKTFITRASLPAFQLATMEANVATPLFKKPTNVKVVGKIDIDIDLIMSMPMVVENYLQPTTPTTCGKPSRTRQRMCAQAKE